MQDQDQEDLEGGPQPLKRPYHLQPADDPAKSEVSSCEQDMSPVLTRWQRFKQHPAFQHRAFKTVVAAFGIAVAGGAVVLTTRPDEEIEQGGTSVVKADRHSTEADFESVDDGVRRKSPSEHWVSGYQRSQRHGPGNTKTKMVNIPPHSRGGSA